MLNLTLPYVRIYADIEKNHLGSVEKAGQLIDTIRALDDPSGIRVLPKIQLYSEETWPREWPLPCSHFVPSVFRPADIEFAMRFRPLAIKIASVESTYYELIRLALATKLPVLIATGGMVLDELRELVRATELLRNIPDFSLMHCVSMYPTPTNKLNLWRINALKSLTPHPGLSLHMEELDAMTVSSCLAFAYALGVRDFEFHVGFCEAPWTISLAYLEFIATKMIPNIISMAGTGDLLQADRADVLDWRKRWQE